MKKHATLFIALCAIISTLCFFLLGGQETLEAQQASQQLFVPPVDFMGLHMKHFESYFKITPADKYVKILDVPRGNKFIIRDIVTFDVEFLILAADYKNKYIKAELPMFADRMHLQAGIVFRSNESVYVKTNTPGSVLLCGIFVEL
ncbi:MAG: hypothetical protein ACYTG7_16865 [Planctomycetota bacterium]|jgi:hypothetical protein